MITTGRVYKIINSIDNEIYVGSTFNQLRHRWQGHKQDYKQWINGKSRCKCSIFDKFKLLGIENFKIMLIKEYLVYREHKKDFKHLHSKEQLWINKLKCINVQCSFNPIPRKEYHKQYKLNNKNKISEQLKIKINCSCGSIINKISKNRHQKTKKHKQWVKNNIEQLKNKKVIIVNNTLTDDEIKIFKTYSKDE